MEKAFKRIENINGSYFDFDAIFVGGKFGETFGSAFCDFRC